MSKVLTEEECVEHDKRYLLAIQELLDGRQWYTEAIDQIAMIVEGAGYVIRTFGEMRTDDLSLADRKKRNRRKSRKSK